MKCLICNTANDDKANYCHNCAAEFPKHKDLRESEERRIKKLEIDAKQLKEVQRSLPNLKKQIKFLRFFAALFVIIALIFAYLFYNSSGKQSSETPTLTDSIQSLQTAATPNRISTSTGANSAVTVNGNSITVNANNGNIDTTINGKRIIVNTGGVIIKKQTPKQEQSVTPPYLAEQVRKKQVEQTAEQAKKKQAKQALEKANAAFQKGIETGNFEEAYQLYLKSDKKEGYRKFNERAKLCLRYGNNTEYQYFMDYANKLK